MRKGLIFALAFLLLLPLAKADTYLTDCATLNIAGETYYLTQDIINSTASTCMSIIADYVTLDCQGHIINTNITDIYTANTGIDVQGTGVVIKNCILTGWYTGIYVYYSSSNTLQNLTIISRGEGIRLYYSDSTTLTDVTISNTPWGLSIISSDYTNVFNSTIKDNIIDILYSTTRGEMYCHSYFENVTGTGDKPIVFFNSTVEIRDWDNNASEIILCGADNSIVGNLRMNNNSGLQVIASNNVTVANSSFENVQYWVQFRYSDNNTISNSNISYAGIALSYANYNTVNNLRIGNGIGIYLSYANYNTISNSIVENCTYGIFLRNSANNSIYNNLFNNTNNFGFSGTRYPNYWNTTRQPGTRIYSLGNEIGGNYWTNPEGTGYSDTCTDADKDGFCDDPYVLATDNVDYLPLSNQYSPPTTTLPPVHGVPLLSSTLVGLVIGSGIIIFMLRTLFDIREPKKVIEYFIVLAVIVLTVLSLIALFA